MFKRILYRTAVQEVLAKKKCRLCDAYPADKDLGLFYLVEQCDNCKIPIVVLKEHRKDLNEEESFEFKRLLEEEFPNYKPRGIGMRTIPDHWHEHLVKK